MVEVEAFLLNLKRNFTAHLLRSVSSRDSLLVGERGDLFSPYRLNSLQLSKNLKGIERSFFRDTKRGLFLFSLVKNGKVLASGTFTFTL